MPSPSLSAVRPALQTPAELLAAGRPADAAEALAAVVAGAPTYAAAYVLLGVALDAAGRPAEALQAWHRAAFLVPRSPLVLRERQRLIDATQAAADALGPDAVAEVAGPAGAPQTLEVAPDAPEDDWLAPEDAAPEDAAPDAGADDDPVIETAPLDDFVFLDAPAAGGSDGFDPSGFDPDGFDFSAFDTDDAGESWLGTDDALPDARASPDADSAALGGAPADPFADPFGGWGDRPEPDAVRILLPDDAVPAEPAPREADEAWAVFEDLPAPTPPAGVPAPQAADMLTPDGATAAPAAPDDWFVDAAFAAPTPVFHEPVTDESPETDAFAVDDAGTDAAEPDAFATDRVVADEPVADENAAPPSASVFAEPASGSVADELDLLIASLETAPRIRPDPAFAGPAVRVPAADTGEMASETLARIYAAQHQYAQAALVYETLAAREPERAEALLGQAAEMRARRP